MVSVNLLLNVNFSFKFISILVLFTLVLLAAENFIFEWTGAYKWALMGVNWHKVCELYQQKLASYLFNASYPVVWDLPHFSLATKSFQEMC